MSSKKKYAPDYGKHLIIDAYGIGSGKLKNRKSIRGLLNFLPGFMGMKKLGNVVLHKVTSPDYDGWGLSGFVMLLESHISCHTWPEIGYVSMDVYSCRDYDHQKVIKHLKKFWRYKRLVTKIVVRKQK